MVISGGASIHCGHSATKSLELDPGPPWGCQNAVHPWLRAQVPLRRSAHYGRFRADAPIFGYRPKALQGNGCENQFTDPRSVAPSLSVVRKSGGHSNYFQDSSSLTAGISINDLLALDPLRVKHILRWDLRVMYGQHVNPPT